MSFLQIYNEEIFDLLSTSKKSKKQQERGLKIREDKLQGIYVEGLSEYIVTQKQQCYDLLIKGERIRAKRSTRLNIQSSRSHSLFQLLIESDIADEKGMLKRAKLNIGDLAGSEKIFLEEFPNVQHMNELKNINLSLSTLGKVISLLSQQTDANPLHVPFRESKLTRLLQDSLGGNTRTCLIGTISPTIDFLDESISTLKFADRAKCVTMKITKNEINAQDDALIQKLQKEINYLKELLRLKRKGDKQNIQQQLYQLKEENDRLKEMALSVSEVEHLKQENKVMRIELQKVSTGNDRMTDFDDSSIHSKVFNQDTNNSHRSIFLTGVNNYSYESNDQQAKSNDQSSTIVYVKKKFDESGINDSQQYNQLPTFTNGLLFSFEDRNKDEGRNAYKSNQTIQAKDYEKDLEEENSTSYETYAAFRNLENRIGKSRNVEVKINRSVIVNNQQQDQDSKMFKNIQRMLRGQKEIEYQDINDSKQRLQTLPEINNYNQSQTISPAKSTFKTNRNISKSPLFARPIYSTKTNEPSKLAYSNIQGQGNSFSNFLLRRNSNQAFSKFQNIGVIAEPKEATISYKAKRNIVNPLKTQEEEDAKFKVEQDLIMKKASQRLIRIEQMEQQRKLKFQRELEKLQKEQQESLNISKGSLEKSTTPIRNNIFSTNARYK